METTEKSLWRRLLELYGTFFKIGLFTFGGGYAMLPILDREVAQKKKWTTSEDLLDIYALGQCTPGVIAVNTATFLGNKVAKVPGAVFATLGIISPSLIIISTIAALFQNFADNVYVAHAMAAVRVAVAALIFTTVIKMCKGAFRWWPQILIAVIAFAVVALLGANPVWVVLGAGLFGFFFLDVGKISKKPRTPASDKDEKTEEGGAST
ncbi:MAG: chromate transporter [Clostridia bacterium]|nr:chromate transporter [Clostridia bacterium]